MPGVNLEFCSHKLSKYDRYKPIAQKKKRLRPEIKKIAAKQNDELLKGDIIKELHYTTLLANVVLVPKKNGKWRICTDYTNLNKACPKDPFPLSNIDQLVDNSTWYEVLSFMDAYSGYNQIPMYERDEEKITFIIDKGIFCYKMMPFGLKNVGPTIQWMMTKVFEGMLEKEVEVYIDVIVAKIAPPSNHVDDLARIFSHLKQHNACFNAAKYTFSVSVGSFLGYMLNQRGIKANPSKCKAMLQMISPKTCKEVQQLNGRIIALTRFMSKIAHQSLPLY